MHNDGMGNLFGDEDMHFPKINKHLSA